MRSTKGTDSLFDIEIPMAEELENLRLPTLESVALWRNFKDRILTINCDIDDYIFEYIKMIIRFNQEDKDLKIEDRKPIKIWISSYGGDLNVGNALISCIELSKTPVYVYGIGIVGSMAALIFLSGHKRYALPKSTFLIHQGSAGVQGQTGQVLDMANNIKRTEEDIKDYILSHTKIDKKLYAKKAKTEWYLTPLEALELNVCDEIVSDIDLLY